MPKVPKIWKVKLPIKQLSRLSRILQFSLSHPSQHPAVVTNDVLYNKFCGALSVRAY